MIKLTGSQRYRQAVLKVHIQATREAREFLAGKRGFLPGNIVGRERDAVIREIDRAYEAGAWDAAQADRAATMRQRIMVAAKAWAEDFAIVSFEGHGAIDALTDAVVKAVNGEPPAEKPKGRRSKKILDGRLVEVDTP